MIPGLAHGLAGAVPLVDLELIGIGLGNATSVVSYSHTPQPGDIAILSNISGLSYIDSDGSGDPQPPPNKVIPSGFTELQDETHQRRSFSTEHGGRITVSGRICDGTEGASVSGMTSGTRRLVLALFRPSVPVVFDAALTGSAVAKGDGTTGVLPVSLGPRSKAPVLHIVCYRYLQNEANAVTGVPALASLDSGRNGHRTSWAYQRRPADLAAQSAQLTVSRNNHFIGTILGLALRP